MMNDIPVGCMGNDSHVRIAMAFHESYEGLAAFYGYETRPASAVPWDQLPPENRNLMCSTVKDLIDRGIIHVAD